jgi:hypothetical protein
MTLTVEDRLAITELISWHGHHADGDRLDALADVFAADAEFDLTDLGAGTVHGLATLLELAEGTTGHPVGHHVTNVVLTALDDGRVRARSKGIGISADGSAGSVTYDDTVARRPEGWRITHRRILTPRRLNRG